MENHSYPSNFDSNTFVLAWRSGSSSIISRSPFWTDFPDSTNTSLTNPSVPARIFALSGGQIMPWATVIKGNGARNKMLTTSSTNELLAITARRLLLLVLGLVSTNLRCL